MPAGAGPTAAALETMHPVYYNYDPATASRARAGTGGVLPDDCPTPGFPAGTSRLVTARRALDLTPGPRFSQLLATGLERV